MQRRLRAEIKETLEAYDGEPTYESVHGMKFLGMVFSGELMNFNIKYVPITIIKFGFKETLRMYPPLPFLDRECTVPANSAGYDLQSYSIDFKIPNGMSVIIPVRAIHQDPNVSTNLIKKNKKRRTLRTCIFLSIGRTRKSLIRSASHPKTKRRSYHTATYRLVPDSTIVLVDDLVRCKHDLDSLSFFKIIEWKLQSLRSNIRSLINDL